MLKLLFCFQISLFYYCSIKTQTTKLKAEMRATSRITLLWVATARNIFTNSCSLTFSVSDDLDVNDRLK